MKKIIALLLTLSLLLCMNATVFAAEDDVSENEPVSTVEDSSETAVESTTEEESDPADKPVMPETTDPVEKSEIPESTEPAEGAVGTESNAATEESEDSQISEGDDANDVLPIDDAEPDDVSLMAVNDTTYSVTVSWVGLSFTYHAPSKGTWNPNASPPQYEGGSEKGTWTSSDDSKSYGTITITNNSSVGSDNLEVYFSFDKDVAFGNKTVRMRFADSENTVSSSKTYSHIISVEAPTQDKFPTTGKVYVVPAIGDNVGAANFENASNKLGTITIRIVLEDLNDPPAVEGPGIFDDESVGDSDLGVAEVDPPSSEQPGIE